jgi:hypothetical protein
MPVKDELYVNFGIYGYIENKNFLSLNKKIEEYVKKINGLKWLYGQSYYDENVFYEIYPNIKCDKFVCLYDKCCEFYNKIKI